MFTPSVTLKSLLETTITGCLVLGLLLSASPAYAKRVKITEEHNKICEGAAALMEDKYDIPDNIMHGIVRTESSSYPWVINWSGNGEFFHTKEEAINRVEQLLARGKKSIDVGCAQINLYWHPKAFASLDEAFDPVTNLDYAARHLLELKEDQGFSTWFSSVAMYHSGKRKSERGDNYARIVYRHIKSKPAIEPYVYDGNKQDGGRPVPNMTAQDPVEETRKATESEVQIAERDMSTSLNAVTLSTKSVSAKIRDRGYDLDRVFPYEFSLNEFFGEDQHSINQRAVTGSISETSQSRVSNMQGVIGNLN